ncbi:MFS transporter [Kocuria dechangensis]|uniref:MFS transporter n=1 Tax=Kocuria dechangensis TaxID=1176249 RepID=A0A917GER6_9MICC|nr:sugar porter family MFS transporter [Kocuria dechangensis]GGG42177.1 MFS transporter [Kocuria dechangensis]
MSHGAPITHAVDLQLPPVGACPHNRRLGLVAVMATFGGLLFGYDTGVLNGALSFMTDYFGITPTQEGLITFVLLIGAGIGALAGGRISDRIGRRQNIIILAVLFFIGALGCALAPTFLSLLAFRLVLGLAVGGASVTVPVYLAEVAPFENRGSIVSRNELMIVSGQFLAFAINAVIGNVWGENENVWRYMLIIAVLPAVVLFFGMLRMPESPRWLIAHGREDEALEVLRQVRSEERAQAEMAEVRALAEMEKQEQLGGWADIKSLPWVRRLLFIGLGLAAYQQLTGINSMMYYGTQVLEEAGFSRNAALSFNVLNGVMSVGAMLVALAIINRFNRRTLLIFGFTGTTIAHLLVGFVGLGLPEGNALRPWLLMLCILAFIGIMQGTIGPLVWLMIAEIYPLKFRGVMIGVTVLALWTTNAIVSLVFPPLVAALGFGTFLLFAFVGFLALLFVATSVPETRGKTLEDLEAEFEANYNTV